jgi:hypothetical protein
MIINSGRNLSRLYSLQQLPDGNSGNYQYSVKNKHLNYPEFSVCRGRIMTTHCYFSPSIAKTYSWKILGPTTLLLPFCHWALGVRPQGCPEHQHKTLTFMCKQFINKAWTNASYSSWTSFLICFLRFRFSSSKSVSWALRAVISMIISWLSSAT